MKKKKKKVMIVDDMKVDDNLEFQVYTYCSPHCSSGASRVNYPNLCFIAKIVQSEDFLLILQQDNLEEARTDCGCHPKKKKKKHHLPTCNIWRIQLLGG